MASETGDDPLDGLGGGAACRGFRGAADQEDQQACPDKNNLVSAGGRFHAGFLDRELGNH